MIYSQDPDLNELDELTEEHLGFSALSEGLGFHQNKATPPPVTIKAPAAPAVKESPLSGPHAPAGASQAGPAMPVLQVPKTVRAPETATAAALPSIRDPGAGPAARSAALLADVFFALVPLLATANLVGGDARSFLRADMYSAAFLALYLCVYFLLAESLGGQSPGKMLFSLQIVEDDKYQKPIGFRLALARLLIFLPTSVLAGIGLFWSLADSKRRTLHDKWTGTIVRQMEKRS